MPAVWPAPAGGGAGCCAEREMRWTAGVCSLNTEPDAEQPIPRKRSRTWSSRPPQKTQVAASIAPMAHDPVLRLSSLVLRSFWVTPVTSFAVTSSRVEDFGNGGPPYEESSRFNDGEQATPRRNAATAEERMNQERRSRLYCSSFGYIIMWYSQRHVTAPARIRASPFPSRFFPCPGTRSTSSSRSRTGSVMAIRSCRTSPSAPTAPCG